MESVMKAQSDYELCLLRLQTDHLIGISLVCRIYPGGSDIGHGTTQKPCLNLDYEKPFQLLIS